MTPVIHCSVGNIHLFPRTTFIQRKGIQLTKYNVPGKFSRPTTHSQRFLLTQSSLQLFQIYRNGCVYKYGSTVQTVAAVGTDLTVEETTPAVSGEDTDETSGNPSDSVKTNESPPANPAVASTAKSKRQRPGRKSDMPPIKNEELVPGATFTGKVRSIQPFGAFVDFGAFTDGLVHVSRMSDGYVKDVNALVSIGQEVKVRIVEANIESGRISLSMRENDDTSKMQQRKETSASGSSDRPRPVRKNAGRSNQRREEGQKTSKFVKGQVLDGTVKNLTRSGAFVSLPDGEEGFIPVSEESEGFGNVLGNSSLQVGQEVNVRVLRITRGQVTLTMKKEEDIEGMNKRLNQGVVHIATNPFELAFRKNKDIASFLDEQEKARKSSQKVSKPKTSEEAENKVDETTSLAGTEAEGKETTSEAIPKEISLEEPTSSEPVRSNEEPVSESLQTVNAVLDDDSSSTLTEIPIPDDLKDSSMAIGMAEEQVSASETLVSEGCESSANLVADEASITNESKEPSVITESTEENKVLTSETLTFDPIAGEDSNTGDLTDNSSEGGISEEVASAEADDTVSTEAVEFEKPLLIEDAVTSGDPTDAKLEVPEATNGQTENPNQGSAVKATISPALVKQLREETGAGMMDCKKALTETGGDLVKAQEFLRTKGLASADKKASRTTAEGRIGSYIHDSRIGVLIEVNCETDFVSRGEIFKQLVDDLAMQVAACPQVQYLVTEDVPEETVNKEREIEMQKEDLQSKPEQFRSKIVEGRIRKRLEELALLEQPYIKNDKVVVKDLVKQTIATIGENIKVRRFIRYNLGEGLEKKSQDFAAEVAAQTAAKDSPAVPKDQPAETKETVEKPPTVTVSAALVKQLREETGAGMMDCKKALSETGGDLEKAQEYLRKKGLSSADKKSSRLAAEGRISSYIHDSRIGCLIEVNCETDFVGRNERFKELADDLAMQVVACPQVEYVSVEDIPESIIIKERELEMQREDLKSKPENIREKIVEGRISKRLGELALLEQPFIKDDSIILKDLVKQTVAGLGENIRVRRFARFTLGESKD